MSTRFVPKNGRKDDSLSKHLERQVSGEIDGIENITNIQKFALRQKFGLEDPILVAEELKAIRAEEVQ